MLCPISRARREMGPSSSGFHPFSTWRVSVEYSRSTSTFRRDLRPANLTTATTTTGLRYWMARVLEECEHVETDFSADPVHDLRVSLRRCRSVADGMIAIDPDRDWKAMT